MSLHHSKYGHQVHHKIEMKTSIIGPVYKCHMCGETYTTIIEAKMFGERMRYCLDCEEQIHLIDRTAQHILEIQEKEEEFISNNGGTTCNKRRVKCSMGKYYYGESKPCEYCDREIE